MGPPIKKTSDGKQKTHTSKRTSKREGTKAPPVSKHPSKLRLTACVVDRIVECVDSNFWSIMRTFSNHCRTLRTVSERFHITSFLLQLSLICCPHASWHRSLGAAGNLGMLLNPRTAERLREWTLQQRFLIAFVLGGRFLLQCVIWAHFQGVLVQVDDGNFE